MANNTMIIRYYPVGNGDSALVENDDGKHLMIDYNCPSESEDDDDDRIFLQGELDQRLKGKHLDVLMITHAHDDHLHGFSGYFWLECSKKHQTDDRKKFIELWVPDPVIWEAGVEGEEELLRREARYRLLDQKKGIKVFGESDSLIDFIEDSGKVTYEQVKHLIFNPGEIIKDFSGFDIFIHSPHAWTTEEDEEKNNKCIVIQADFHIAGQSVAKVMFGSDAESDAWESIYSATKNNNNLDKLEFDVFKLAHHCSYTALNRDEKGDLITIPVKNVKKIFEQHGQQGCFLIASSNSIPRREDRDKPGPPHYQAAEYYREVAHEKGGKFEVTMEQPKGPKSRKPIVIEITRFGPRIDHLATAGIGAGIITSSRSERHGTRVL